MEKLNVAIADDNEKMVEVLGQIIEEDKDLELVGKAHNGEEICNIIREKEPDVVVLDIIMPKMDGLAVMEKFANDKSLKKIPSFIVVSAVGQERITENAFNLGADYYILKPFDNQMLLNRIKHVRRASAPCFSEEVCSCDRLLSSMSAKSVAARCCLKLFLSSASHIRCHCCGVTLRGCGFWLSMVGAQSIAPFLVLNTATRWMRFKSMCSSVVWNKSTFSSGLLSAKA